ncbi:hypothetical protein ABW20_dc0109687 [Dactylellina cionopaga]|nr:hypothetical protein ABW20_dc0109687 [Dactylellina cionopaga]
MPVKWTAENDHLLLLTLLETHNIKVDGEKIRAAWPQTAGEQPTARAIRERIVKIRTLTGSSPAKQSGGSHVNNGVKKESSTKKKAPGKQRQRKPSVDEDDEEVISQSFTTQTTQEATPCPSPRKKRVSRIKVEQVHQLDSEISDAIDLESSCDDFVPMKTGAVDEDEDSDYLGD